MKDRISFKIGSVSFILSPLSYLQKQELSDCTRMVAGEQHFDLVKAQSLYVKYSLKDIKGLKDYNGEDYKLEFDGDFLTDDCVSEILNLEEREKLTNASWQILNGIKPLEDPVTGKKLAGVKMEIIAGK